MNRERNNYVCFCSWKYVVYDFMIPWSVFTGLLASLSCSTFLFLLGGTKGLLLWKKNVMSIVGGSTMTAPAITESND